jgi:SAM-dependent methyltransferase
MTIVLFSSQIERVSRAWQEAESDSATHYRGFTEWHQRLMQLIPGGLSGLRMLDIGCGDRAPLSLLFAQRGLLVNAIDLLPVQLGWRRPLMWPAVALSDGVPQMVKQMVRDAAHTWRYWQRLGRQSGDGLPFDAVRVQRMDATDLHFADASFDLVVSSAVWEHISDVRAATREVNRVLAPGGLAVIQVAVFPALKGGHHAEWHSVSAGVRRTIRPWDHLRDGAEPLPLYCNGWRAGQYREVFEQEMAIAEWEEAPSEGAEYLTPQLRQELAEYTEKDLLMPFVTIWARKRVAAGSSTANGRSRALAGGVRG